MNEKFLSNLKDALEIEDREISLDDKFREYPEWDSIGQLSVIAMVDEEYGVVIDGNLFKELYTNGDMLNTIIKLQKV